MEKESNNLHKSSSASSSQVEEDEPKLKYQRLVGSLPKLVESDAISSIAVCSKFIVIGTHEGSLSVLDLEGNQVETVHVHSASINQLSIDEAAEYIASCSDDGQVVISSILDMSDQPQAFNYKRPVKAVAIEPRYAKSSTKQFCSGGMAEYVNLSGKGWFSYTTVVIDSGEGPIYDIKWREPFIAFANDFGVKIYDIQSQQKFAHIERSQDAPRADLYRCHLCWKSDIELLIGWADSVKIGLIKDRPKLEVASGLPNRFIEIICQFRVDFIVSGIAPLQDSILILSFIVDVASEVKDVDVLQDAPRKKTKSQPAEIHVVDYNGQILANDLISLATYEAFKANDYHLEYLESDVSSLEDTYYIVSPKDIVVAKQRDKDDHIQWLLERDRYEDALQIAEEMEKSSPVFIASSKRVTNIISIGQKWLDSLMTQGQFDKVAANCSKILRQDKSLWESWIFRFAEAKKINEICQFVPICDPVLNSNVYELILAFYLNVDLHKMRDLVAEWPPQIYNIRNVISAVEECLHNDPLNQSLMEVACELYAQNGQYDMQFYFGLILLKKDILELVKNHNLYSFIAGLNQKDASPLLFESSSFRFRQNEAFRSRIQLLFEYDEYMILQEYERLKPLTEEPSHLIHQQPSLWKIRKAGEIGAGLKLLIDHCDRIPISHVVNQLRSAAKYLHIYLDALFQRDSTEATEYHPLQVYLYAEYDYPRLMDFLRSSTHYSYDKALEICELRQMVPEMVFLYGKLGNHRKALMLIIEELGDVYRAIEFVKEQNDDDLWEDLLTYAMDKPPFIVGMLQNLGAYINPVKLVQRIPNGLVIPGLRDALTKILYDFSVQVSLREGCDHILTNDTILLFDQLYRARRKATKHACDETCSICGDQIQKQETAQIVFFNCNHCFHLSCCDGSVSSTKEENLEYLRVQRATDFVYNSNVNVISKTQPAPVEVDFGCPICCKRK